MSCLLYDSVPGFMRFPSSGFELSKNGGQHSAIGAVKNARSALVFRQESLGKQQIMPQPGQGRNTARRQERPTPPEKGWSRFSLLIAAVLALTLGLGIWIGVGLGVRSSEHWRENVLASDAVPYQSQDHWGQDDEAETYPVFGSVYRREQIKNVTVLNTLEDVPADAWDVSVTGDNSVMAWVKPNGELYDLYLGAEGGINAAVACKDLFAGYTNVERVDLGSAFHTDDALDMSRMFFGCYDLKELKMDRFNTSKVRDMSYMFCYCLSLKGVDVSCFDTGRVQDMRSMFSWCQSLEGLNLSGFDTANVQNMKEMFYSCDSLESLDLSAFDTKNVQDMTDMFYLCPAGDEYHHLHH